MGIALAAGVAAVSVLLAVGAAAEPRVGVVRRDIARQAEELRMPLERLDLDALAREAEARFWRGESSRAIASWLTDEFLRARYAFAPADAQHRRGARYALPYDQTFPRFLSRGPGGPSHQGREYHAWDFTMPEGTPVLAARRGKVALVIDGFGPGAPEARSRGKANVVAILHRDGTFALYVHLRAGIPVREGDAIRKGDLVGWSGSSGWVEAPHLHFYVARRGEQGLPESIPVRFAKPDEKPLRLVPQRFYGVRPETSGTLEISVDGGGVVDGQPLPLARGASVQLRVRFVPSGGEGQDVTRDPATRYVVASVWNLRTDAPGRVTARPSDGFGDTWLRRFPTALVTITYRDAESGAFAFADVGFDLPVEPEGG